MTLVLLIYSVVPSPCDFIIAAAAASHMYVVLNNASVILSGNE